MSHGEEKPQNINRLRFIAVCFGIIMIAALVGAEMTTTSSTNPFPEGKEVTTQQTVSSGSVVHAQSKVAIKEAQKTIK